MRWQTTTSHATLSLSISPPSPLVGLLEKISFKRWFKGWEGVRWPDFVRKSVQDRQRSTWKWPNNKCYSLFKAWRIGLCIFRPLPGSLPNFCLLHSFFPILFKNEMMHVMKGESGIYLWFFYCPAIENVIFEFWWSIFKATVQLPH